METLIHYINRTNNRFLTTIISSDWPNLFSQTLRSPKHEICFLLVMLFKCIINPICSWNQ